MTDGRARLPARRPQASVAARIHQNRRKHSAYPGILRVETDGPARSDHGRLKTTHPGGEQAKVALHPCAARRERERTVVLARAT
jgi:hypothetical protein